MKSSMHNWYNFLSTSDLSAPLQPEFFPESHTSAVLSWTPPMESSCIAIYNVTFTKVTVENTSYTYIYSTTANVTSITVSNLNFGERYLFTVTGIDAEGRVGENSVPSQIVTFES